MKPRLRCTFRPLILVIGLLGALLPCAAFAQEEQPRPRPFLWRMEAETPSYLFGTIHLPDERVLSLPDPVTRAIERCDALYTELPMNLELQVAAAKNMYLPGRETLEDKLSTELYERLAAYLKGKGLSVQMFKKMKVWALAAQLPVLDFFRRAAGKQPLDLKLYSDAERDGKEVGGLETMEEQLAVFEEFTDAEHELFLADTLDQLEEADRKGEDFIERLLELYLGGDAEGLMKMMHETSGLPKQLRDRFMEKLLYERNERIADRIAEKLEAEPDKSFFFAVGAAHYPDDRGLIELLTAKGYRITRLPVDETELKALINRLERELEAARRELDNLRRRQPAGSRR